MMDNRKIDLHMHSSMSDGTDTPDELLEVVRNAGIPMFALTDHDTVKGCTRIREIRSEDDPLLLTGVEFSCRDEEGKYHILGYGFDPESRAIQEVIETGHRLRMNKVTARLDFLQKTFGFSFAKEDIQDLMALATPGKPHIANLMVKYGYTPTRKQAIHEYIDQISFPSQYVRPEEAIQGILHAGGIPVLAHPVFGSGEELILGDEMDQRLRRLIGFGLQGMEAFYSGFTPKLISGVLSLAEKYRLYVTAGSDYHGKNKLVVPGDTNLTEDIDLPDGLSRFLKTVEHT